MVESVKLRRFGRYQLDRLIGRGGMGEIYLAQMEGSAGFKKPVCIKKILSHLSREREFVTRFIDEAHIVVTLMHGNIVQVLDMGEVDGEYFLAMEYVPGRDLREIVKRYAKRAELMPPSIVAYIVSEIGKALSYAHKKSDEQGNPLHIIHRDVSPSNVLVSREGVVKLTDFGIAKAVGKLGKSITGRLQGKFCYMSPEQAAGRSVDHRSDIFSMATVAYELLTGVRPFEADSDLATLEAVKRAKSPPPSSLRPELSSAVDDVLARALAREPEDRYASAADFARDLAEAISPSRAATDSDVAAELSRLFPGEEAAFATPARGLGLDEALALEADRALQASPFGESPTLTADVKPGGSAQSEPAVVASVQPAPILEAGLGPTPTPSVPQFTPTPMSEYAFPVAAKRRRWRALAIVALLIGIAALLLWVEPAYLLHTSLRVDCTPEGAEVLIDNEVVGRCGVTKSVDAGSHRVVAQMAGYFEAETEVELARGEERRIELALERDPRIETTIWVQPEYGRFWVEGGPDSRWYTSGASLRIEPGEYEVTAVATGYRTVSQRVRLAEGEHVEIKLEREAELVAELVADPADPIVEPQPEETAEVAVVEPEETEPEVRPERRSHVELELTDIPDGAALFIDDEPQTVGADGTFRRRFENESRSFGIRVTKEGYQDWTMTYNPARARDTERAVELEPVPQLRPVRIWITNPATGEVHVDGERMGRAPTVLELEVGRTYTVRVENAMADADETRTITVAPGDGPQVEYFFQR